MLKRLLEISRFLLVLPVIGSLLLMLATVIMGFGVIVARAWELTGNVEFTPKSAKTLSVTVIQTIDLFLVGALGYITAVGIYKLFISQREEQLLKRIKIESLVDLENKIIGVVVAALAVAFLGDATGEAADGETIFYAGVGKALVIVALCLFTKFAAEPKESESS